MLSGCAHHRCSLCMCVNVAVVGWTVSASASIPPDFSVVCFPRITHSIMMPQTFLVVDAVFIARLSMVSTFCTASWYSSAPLAYIPWWPEPSSSQAVVVSLLLLKMPWIPAHVVPCMSTADCECFCSGTSIGVGMCCSGTR
jgi:hypothetical protein